MAGRDAKDFTCWVVWSTGTPPTSFPTTMMGLSDIRNGDQTQGPGMAVEVEADSFVFTISPSSITDLDSDIPDLRGSHNGEVPGESLTHVVTGSTLAGGADKKWDISRRIRVKILNPHLYTQDDLEDVPGHMYDNQPASVDVPEDYPGSDVIGNDDTSVVYEDNNPYESNVGKLTSYDAPRVPIRHSTGSNGDTFEVRFHYQEFARLQLDSTWYPISGPVSWRAHFKYERMLGLWKDDGSDGAANNSGWD